MQNTPVPRGPVITVYGPSYSDGDSNHRPNMTIYLRTNPTLWMTKIATKRAVEEAAGSSGKRVQVARNLFHLLPQNPRG